MVIKLVKLKAFIFACVLSVLTLGILTLFYFKDVFEYYKVSDNSVKYTVSDLKDKNSDILLSNITENTLVLMGSSELFVTKHKEYHPKQLFNYSDFNILQIGEVDSQNIIHASILASIGDEMPNKKVVLIESIQWFNRDGFPGKKFINKISIEHVYRTMTNPKIKQETKRKFIERLIELSVDDTELNNTFKTYKAAFVDGEFDPFIPLSVSVEAYLYSLKNRMLFFERREKENLSLNTGSVYSIDWENLEKSEIQKNKSTTNNNQYGIDNDYYLRFIKDKYEHLKNSHSLYNDPGYVDLNSIEYKDMELFLEIAKDLGVEVLVAVFPVNGSWFDYTGFYAERRQPTYKKIVELAKQYNADVYDGSPFEYDDDYMYDPIHIGVKGWINLSKKMIEFQNR